MLFYERIETENNDNITENKSIIPSFIYKKIWEENMAFLNDKNIYDPDYFGFLWRIVSLDKSPPIMTYDTTSLDLNTDPAMRSIQLGTRFIIHTLSHAKEKSYLKEYTDYLKTLYSRHIPACKWFLELLISDSNYKWLKQILFLCTVQETREILAKLITHVLSCIAPFEKEHYQEIESNIVDMEISDTKNNNQTNIVEHNPLAVKLEGKAKTLSIQLMDILLGPLLKEVSSYWHNFSSYFLVFRDFANLNPEAKIYFISRNAISLIIDLYLGEDSPFGKLGSKKRIKMGDKTTNPNVIYMVDFLSCMVRTCTRISSTPPPSLIQEPSYPLSTWTLSTLDQEMLSCDILYSKLLRENNNPKAVSEIAIHLSWEDETNSKMFINICTNGIRTVNSDKFKPYFIVFSSLLSLNDSLHSSRVTYGISNYIAVINSNLKFHMDTFYGIQFLTEIVISIPLIGKFLLDNLILWVEPWLISCSEQIRNLAVSLLYSILPINSTINQESAETIQNIHRVYQFLLNLMSHLFIYCKQDAEIFKTVNEMDSSSWHLIQYWRVLKNCAFSNTEKKMFKPYFNDFFNLYSQINDLSLSNDENKYEMFNFLLHVVTDCQENLDVLLTNEIYWNKLICYSISVGASEKLKQFNKISLPIFYTILDILCSQSKKFLENFVTHSNFSWTIDYLFLRTSDYETLSSVLLNILKKCCNESKFRNKYIIKMIAEGEKVYQNPLNFLK